MKLSIFVVTYNQKQYIRQALDSILMQKVDFDYEVIVGEDCSMDGTGAICDEYAAKYPFFHIYHHKTNLGLVKNWEFVLNHCTGEYVAMLEGDDYWIDAHKLQKQVTWLDEHPDYVITSTNVRVLCENGNNAEINLWFNPRKEGNVNPIEYLCPGICHTSSVVMRNVLSDMKYPDWVFITDTFTFLLAAKYGKAYHFENEMSVYRRHGNNVTQQDSFANIQSTMRWATQHRKMQDMFPFLKTQLATFEDGELMHLSQVPYKQVPHSLWKYRLRYMCLHKHLFFSKFALKTLYIMLRPNKSKNNFL